MWDSMDGSLLLPSDKFNILNLSDARIMTRLYNLPRALNRVIDMCKPDMLIVYDVYFVCYTLLSCRPLASDA